MLCLLCCVVFVCLFVLSVYFASLNKTDALVRLPFFGVCMCLCVPFLQIKKQLTDFDEIWKNVMPLNATSASYVLITYD